MIKVRILEIQKRNTTNVTKDLLYLCDQVHKFLIFLSGMWDIIL